VFCWDITYLPSTVRGQFYYLYMIEDIYSRKIVGFEVYDREAGDLAAKLLERTLLSENAIGRFVQGRALCCDSIRQAQFR
jgi:putative transposase